MRFDQTTASGPSGAYIRGAGGVLVEGRRLARRLVVVVLVGLTALTLTLTVDAARAAQRIHRLQVDGVEVPVTVTSCLGIASGTGMTPVGFTCRGRFILNGHTYTDVIAGSSVLRPPGQTLTGITDPGRRSVLSTVAAIETAPSAARRLMLPALLWLLLVIALLVTLRLRRAGRAVIGPE